MKTIRRLYFYLVTLISLEVVLWGVIGLLRSMFSRTPVGTAEVLARALALVLVGVPVFLFHWLWAQRTAGQDEEEQTALLRALFFFTVLGATLFPAIQNVLAWLDRLLLSLLGAPLGDAFWGARQTGMDNGIAILANLIVALYFLRTLRQTWSRLPDDAQFADARRLYRYLWLLYAILVSVSGVREVLMYLLYVPEPGVVGAGRNAHLANGLALVLIGMPLWYFTWRICQRALSAERERASNLRLGVLYLLAWGGAIVSVTAAASALSEVLQALLGAPGGWHAALRGLRESLSVAIPLGGVWFYYSRWLLAHIALDEDAESQAGKRRLYAYLLAFIGLAMAVSGLLLLLSFLVDLLTGQNVWGGGLRQRLSAALSILSVGLWLWLPRWRRLQAEAISEQAQGSASRRSVVRRTYLYLALFVGVLGGMGAAVGLVFQVLSALLSGRVPEGFLASVLNTAAALLVFVVLLVYHLRTLRADTALEAAHPRGVDFPVLVVDAGDPDWLQALLGALQRQTLSVQVLAADSWPVDAPAARAVLLSPGTALQPPDGLEMFLHTFEGLKILVGAPPAGWLLPTLSPRQAAALIRQAAEGRQPKLSGASPFWRVVQIGLLVYVGLQVLAVLLSVLFGVFS